MRDTGNPPPVCFVSASADVIYSALASAQSYLRSFNHLSRQDYSMYHWYLPSTQQPLHATIMLLVDLHERPLAAEAAQSRALVDEVLALFSDHSGEAWRMLRRARLGAQQVITKWSCLEEELGNVVSSEHGEIVAGHEDGTAAAGEPVFDWPDWDRVFGFGEDWMEE